VHIACRYVHGMCTSVKQLLILPLAEFRPRGRDLADPGLSSGAMIEMPSQGPEMRLHSRRYRISEIRSRTVNRMSSTCPGGVFSRPDEGRGTRAIVDDEVEPSPGFPWRSAVVGLSGHRYSAPHAVTRVAVTTVASTRVDEEDPVVATVATVRGSVGQADGPGR